MKSFRTVRRSVVGDLSIGQVAQRFGVRTSAIRYYESEGLIPKAARRAGRRFYEAGTLDHLVFIRFALRAGFHIGEIKTMVRGLSSSTKPGDRWRAVADKKLAELNRQIDELRAKKKLLEQLVKCQCPDLAHFARMMLKA
jgi:MerR family redox-sensitive transcriptional activator SoxR